MGRPKGSKNGSGKKRGRKSKAESMTGKKEAAVLVRKVSDGETAELDLPKANDIMFHMKAIKGWKERIATLTGSLRQARQSAKKVNKFLLDTIDELLALERMDDPSEFKRRMEALGIGLKAVGSPYQLTLHDTLLGDARDVAYQKGFKAGELGVALANIYPVGSDLNAEYARGHGNGQAKLLGVNVDEAVPEDAEPLDDDENDDMAPADEEREEGHALA